MRQYDWKICAANIKIHHAWALPSEGKARTGPAAKELPQKSWKHAERLKRIWSFKCFNRTKCTFADAITLKSQEDIDTNTGKKNYGMCTKLPAFFCTKYWILDVRFLAKRLDMVRTYSALPVLLLPALPRAPVSSMSPEPQRMKQLTQMKPWWNHDEIFWNHIGFTLPTS